MSSIRRDSMWYQRGCLLHVLGVYDRVLISLGALNFKCTKVPQRFHILWYPLCFHVTNIFSTNYFCL